MNSLVEAITRRGLKCHDILYVCICINIYNIHNYVDTKMRKVSFSREGGGEAKNKLITTERKYLPIVDNTVMKQTLP